MSRMNLLECSQHPAHAWLYPGAHLSDQEEGLHHALALPAPAPVRDAGAHAEFTCSGSLVHVQLPMANEQEGLHHVLRRLHLLSCVLQLQHASAQGAPIWSHILSCRTNCC